MLNGITRYLKSPYCVHKAIYFLSPLRIQILLKVVTILSFIKYHTFTK